MATAAQLIAQAQAEIAYWAARTGATARRWLKYWSDKLQILKGVVTTPVYPPVTPPVVGQASPPGDVSGQTATYSNPNVSLSWTAATPATGFSIAGYSIERKKSTDSTWVTFGSHLSNSATSDIDTGATPGFTWNYRFKALQSDGQYSTNWSATASVVVSAATNGPDVTPPPTPTLNSPTSITNSSALITCTLVTDPTHSTDVVTGTQLYEFSDNGSVIGTQYHPIVTVAERMLTVGAGSNLTDSGTDLVTTGLSGSLYHPPDAVKFNATQVQGAFNATLTITGRTGRDKSGVHIRYGTDPGAPYVTVGLYYRTDISQAYVTFEYRLAQGGLAAQFSAVAITFPFTVNPIWQPWSNTLSLQYKQGAGAWQTTDANGTTMTIQLPLGRYVEVGKFGLNQAFDGAFDTSYTGWAINLATAITQPISGAAGSAHSVTVRAGDGATQINYSAATSAQVFSLTGGGTGGGTGGYTGSGPNFPRTCYGASGGPMRYDLAKWQTALSKVNFSRWGQYSGLGSNLGGKTYDQCVQEVKALNPNHLIFPYMSSQYVYNTQGAAPHAVVGGWQKDHADKAFNQRWMVYADHTTDPPLRGGTDIGYNCYSVNITDYPAVDSNGDRFNTYYAKALVANEFNGGTVDSSTHIDGFFNDNFNLWGLVDADWKLAGYVQGSEDDTTVRNAYQSGTIKFNTTLNNGLAALYPARTFYQIGNLSWFGVNTGFYIYNNYQDVLNGGVLEYMSGYAPNNSIERQYGFVGALTFFRRAMSFCAAPKLCSWMTHVKYYDSNGNAAPDWRGARYGLGMCLLDNGYFEFEWTDNYYDRWLEVLDEYDCAGTRSIGWMGQATSSPQFGAWQNGVWRRDFQNGIVLVNPSGNGSRIVTLETGFDKIAGSQDSTQNSGATNVTSITLADGDAILLIRRP